MPDQNIIKIVLIKNAGLFTGIFTYFYVLTDKFFKEVNLVSLCIPLKYYSFICHITIPFREIYKHWVLNII